MVVNFPEFSIFSGQQLTWLLFTSEPPAGRNKSSVYSVNGIRNKMMLKRLLVEVPRGLFK